MPQTYHKKINYLKDVINAYCLEEKRLKLLWRWEKQPEKLKFFESRLAFIQKRVIESTRELEMLMNK